MGGEFLKYIRISNVKLLSLFILFFSALVCFQPKELILCLILFKFANFPPSPPPPLSLTFQERKAAQEKQKEREGRERVQRDEMAGGVRACRASNRAFLFCFLIVSNFFLSLSPPPVPVYTIGMGIDPNDVREKASNVKVGVMEGDQM